MGVRGASTSVETTSLEIPSDDFRLAATLHRPSAAGTVPGVVLTGPLSGIKEQVVGTYAAKLAARGIAALAVDHRRFGASTGEPRQHEDADGRLSDLRDAVSAMGRLDGVDPGRLAVLGVCLGAGYALRAAALDPRVRALGLVAGAYNSPRAMVRAMGLEGWRAQLTRALEASAVEQAGGEIAYLPAVSEGDGPAFMPGREPWEYYGTRRGQRDRWENRLTVRSLWSLLTLEAAEVADLVAVPTIMVHGARDDYCSPTAAAETFERLPEPKRFVELSAEEHIDLYDVDVHVDGAVEAVAAWLDEHL